MKYRIYANIMTWELLSVVEKEMIDNVLNEVSDDTDIIIVEQQIDRDEIYYSGIKENYYAKKKVKR